MKLHLNLFGPDVKESVESDVNRFLATLDESMVRDVSFLFALNLDGNPKILAGVLWRISDQPLHPGEALRRQMN